MSRIAAKPPSSFFDWAPRVAPPRASADPVRKARREASPEVSDDALAVVAGSSAEAVFPAAYRP